MRVFVTGATGFVGSAVVKELIANGHKPIGLSRSDAGADALAKLGAEVVRGSLEDVQSLHRGVAEADGVIHLAFNHDFSKYVANCEDDRRVIEALGAALADSKRPLIVTSGTGMVMTPGRAATEHDVPASSATVPRAATEEAADAVATKGVNVSIMRLPQVHDTRRQGLVTYAIQVAREKGVAAYVGDGRNRWPAAHVIDTARLYRLALEKAAPNARYHAVAEEGVAIKDISEAIARRLKLKTASISPDEAFAYFGWLAAFAGLDVPASSEWTRKTLGWQPKEVGMIADLDRLELD